MSNISSLLYTLMNNLKTDHQPRFYLLLTPNGLYIVGYYNCNMVLYYRRLLLRVNKL